MVTKSKRFTAKPPRSPRKCSKFINLGVLCVLAVQISLQYEREIVTYKTDVKTAYLAEQIDELKEQGLYNVIRTIESPMDGRITVDGKDVLNFCANN